MINKIILIFFCMLAPQIILFDFNKETNISDWNIVDDGVMGGKSQGNFELNNQGYAKFSGFVSLKNNGGFSSVRCRIQKENVEQFQQVVLKIKGDGKNYQFRIKDDSQHYYSYIKEFKTSGDWEEITINLNEMYPSFRGRRLDLPNFSSNFIDEIAILIGNKKEENFTLLIDKIYLQ